MDPPHNASWRTAPPPYAGGLRATAASHYWNPPSRWCVQEVLSLYAAAERPPTRNGRTCNIGDAWSSIPQVPLPINRPYRGRTRFFMGRARATAIVLLLVLETACVTVGPPPPSQAPPSEWPAFTLRTKIFESLHTQTGTPFSPGAFSDQLYWADAIWEGTCKVNIRSEGVQAVWIDGADWTTRTHLLEVPKSAPLSHPGIHWWTVTYPTYASQQLVHTFAVWRIQLLDVNGALLEAAGVAFTGEPYAWIAGAFINSPGALKHVLAHELGHTMGLQHSANQQHLMWTGPSAPTNYDVPLTECERARSSDLTLK